VIVEDIPLLVESQMAPMFPLVVVVNADPEVQVRRLIEYRGFTEADARARIAAQATEEQRREVADVWLDNSGSEGQLVELARDLWYQRILPFAHNVATRTPTAHPSTPVPADPTWAQQAGRIINRLNTACGHRAQRIDHIGSTAVPGMDAKDVIDIQITVAALEVADELADDLRAGYPRQLHHHRRAEARRPQRRRSLRSIVIRCCGTSAFTRQTGRPTNIHIRVAGWPNQQFALVFVAWLTATARRCRASIWPSSGPPATTTSRAMRRPRNPGSSTLPARMGLGGRHRLAAVTRSGGLCRHRR
jgi:dephospho-CoA kinase